VDKKIKLEFLLKISWRAVEFHVEVDAMEAIHLQLGVIKNKGLVTGWLYNTSNYCLPYSFAPCSHHVKSKYPDCGASQPTPKCKS